MKTCASEGRARLRAARKEAVHLCHRRPIIVQRAREDGRQPTAERTPNSRASAAMKTCASWGSKLLLNPLDPFKRWMTWSQLLSHFAARFCQ